MLAIAPRQRLLCIVAGALGSHLIQIAIFALALRFLSWGGDIASFEIGRRASLAQAFYISFESYAALGSSQAFSYGPLRIFAGVEGLSGLLPIGWSSAFTYWCMTKYWEEHPPRPKGTRTRTPLDRKEPPPGTERGSGQRAVARRF
uniref:Uncharacterized protein n=1 Tax=Bosea sp. NBC_00436 TaxID=2969620 RepID=A0A9E8CL77_9HYPH